MREEMNKLAKDTLKSLEDNGYLEELQIIDDEMRHNKNPMDKQFYLEKQDRLNYIFGEIKIAYGKLKGQYEKYMVYRKFKTMVQYEKDKEMTINDETIVPKRQPGNEILEDLIKSEVPELLANLILITAYLERADNSIKTARNHTYVTDGTQGRELTK